MTRPFLARLTGLLQADPHAQKEALFPGQALASPSQLDLLNETVSSAMGCSRFPEAYSTAMGPETDLLRLVASPAPLLNIEFVQVVRRVGQACVTVGVGLVFATRAGPIDDCQRGGRLRVVFAHGEFGSRHAHVVAELVWMFSCVPHAIRTEPEFVAMVSSLKDKHASLELQLGEV
ncbi:hypothetical protein BCR44DRAFT_1012204 [Catenaria anguillulae PL171]|uniref:Uncharacterized protein n=1 Tax=Catenaria anguillulae PL171 TaxID=765915 RepID=A0A1Y2I4L1_9FUNG|nr:hypothetical protein BCR44DRAFT_1012204 [Catenaria anguillulae PL171]